MPRIVYQPKGFRIGDTMPFFENGVFYLYHYKTPETGAAEAQNWTLSTTTNFLDYEDHGELFQRGEKGEQDYILRSGTLFRARDGLCHFFYGGDNGAECLLHASGQDPFGLKKDGFILPAQAGYDAREWRDPFVCWCSELGRYLMVVGTRKRNGQRLLNGCSVLLTSQDLVEWHFEGDLYSPGEYTTHEMPDLFELEDRWYHIFSEYSDNTQVIYRMGDAPVGPWRPPAGSGQPRDCGMDGPAYFAGRTVLANGARYLVGWIAGKADANDRAPWTGSGGLWVHQVYAGADGELLVRPPDPIFTAFGDRQVLERDLTLAATGGRREHVLGRVSGGSSLFMVEATVAPAGGTRAFSIGFLANEHTGEAYEYSFLLSESRVSLSAVPNHGITPPDHFRGMEKLTRAVGPASDGKFHITLLYDDTYVILYVNGLALSARVYSRLGDALILSVSDGSVGIEEVSVRQGKPHKH